MPKVFALLVGIDAYRPPLTPLRGCRNDIVLAESLLRDRIASHDLIVESLLDSQATRDAVIAGFRDHLGRAAADDIALFWYSGHGATGPLPDDLRYTESSGECQTIVCWDSRHNGVADLYDKELAVLAGEVVAGGAHLVTVMDCCHSRSGMREVEPGGLSPRAAPALGTAPALDRLLPELVRGVPATAVPGALAPRHVALSACLEHQVAHERTVDRVTYGVFSKALSETVAGLRSEATYREILRGARNLVEGRFRRQVPALEAAPGLADRVFLGGAVRSRKASINLRHLYGKWEVDLGALHGAAVGIRLAPHGTEQGSEVRVIQVLPERSIVEPQDWIPNLDQAYDMVVTGVPLPPVAVLAETGPAVAGLLAAALDTAGPHGGPSPHVRLVPVAEATHASLLLRVRETAGHLLEVIDADDEAAAPAVPADGPGITSTVQDLEHIARWLQVRNLTSPGSALQDAVRIDITPVDEATQIADHVFAYTRSGDTWVPPSIHLRLHNTTRQRLFCALLDLTDRYRMHANLFPGEYVAAEWTAAAAGGGPIVLSLPPGREIRPGAYGTDWLILLVAEEPFNSDPFALPRLRETGTRAATSRGITGILDRLGLLAISRDADPPLPPPALHWTTEVIKVTTVVPAS